MPLPRPSFDSSVPFSAAWIVRSADGREQPYRGDGRDVVETAQHKLVEWMLTTPPGAWVMPAESGQPYPTYVTQDHATRRDGFTASMTIDGAVGPATLTVLAAHARAAGDDAAAHQAVNDMLRGPVTGRLSWLTTAYLVRVATSAASDADVLVYEGTTFPPYGRAPPAPRRTAPAEPAIRDAFGLVGGAPGAATPATTPVAPAALDLSGTRLAESARGASAGVRWWAVGLVGAAAVGVGYALWRAR